MRIVSFDKKAARYVLIRCIHYGEAGGHYAYLILLSAFSHETYRYGAMAVLICSLLRHALHDPPLTPKEEEE